MPVKFLDLHAQYLELREEIDAAITAVLRDAAFIGGAYVRTFEEEFGEYQQVNHCIGVGNGTDALEIAIEALDLPPGCEILVPANSFIATSEAVTRSGHRVVFCDCDPDTYTISSADASTRINDRTAAVIAVHLYGHPCDMGALQDLAHRHGLRVIEDCAQAHGCEFRGKRVGGIGDIGTFSFYPGKNLGAYGDAGAIVTNDPLLAKKARMIANHGRIEKYNHEFEGRNSRLDGIQAAILSVKLKHLEEWIGRRRNVASLYLAGLSGIKGLVVPAEAHWGRHVWHLFVLRTEQRDGLKAHLQQSGIDSGIHYPIALPKLTAYSYLNDQYASLAACSLDGMLLSIPMGEHLQPADITAVIAAVRDFAR